MTLAPIDLMMQRVLKFGADSDAALFNELLYAGELIVKITTAAFIAGIEDDRESHRYRLLHGIIRADGIGEWARLLDEALVGPASQHLVEGAKTDRKTFTERVGRGDWQHEAVSDMREVYGQLNASAELIGDRATLREWFATFAAVRNKTRGHGALTPAACAALVPKLDRSIKLMVERSPIFIRPWAYLHRNLSGKYRVVSIGGDAKAFSELTTAAAVVGNSYPNGSYISFGAPHRVELMHTDLDLSDFYLPNGAFNGKRYELHSLISDSRSDGDAAPYLAVAGVRPPSETHGGVELDVIGKVFTNMPAETNGYIARPQLETEVEELLTNDRHPIVTLVGRGGIGKTSLALKVLHEVAKIDRYDLILWFSARDIDLLMSGPKIVQPQILSQGDIAEEFKKLVGSSVSSTDTKVPAAAFMAKHLHKSSLGPILFVFDNFETVRSPVDLFKWLDTNIRLPNKILITSRFRDFKADYPIQISGMEHPEADKLVTMTAKSLGIEYLVTSKFREQILEEADGHPYVIKIVLGEVADAKTLSKPRSLMARKDEHLDALFERSFANLSPIASRIFLVLSGWRSLVPQLALEAMLLRHSGSGVDPDSGVNELVMMSLVDRTVAPDGADFLGVPLTAALFGLKKLAVSPSQALIENDIKFLHDIGPTAASGLKEGIRPRVEAFFRKVAKKISEKAETLEEMRPMLEFIARGYAPAWLLLADLQQEESGVQGFQQAAEYVRRFIEQDPKSDKVQLAWQRLSRLYRTSHDAIGACGAFVKAAEVNLPPLDQISSLANELNKEREIIENMDLAERGAVFGPLARLMEKYLTEASATDLSRLAWLYLHAGNSPRARTIAELGLSRDPLNLYCRRLVEKLDEGV